MAFKENIKKAEFWKRVLLLALVFFLVFVVMYNLISHFSSIFSGDFQVIYQEEWAEGKWLMNLGSKAVISFFYSLYMVNKREKLGKDKAA